MKNHPLVYWAATGLLTAMMLLAIPYVSRPASRTCGDNPALSKENWPGTLATPTPRTSPYSMSTVASMTGRFPEAGIPLAACKTCGLVQEIERYPQDTQLCPRCGFAVHRRKPDSARRTFAFALAAFILYFPANLLPIVQVEYHGIPEETTIFQGITSLFRSGNYFIGAVMFTTSMATPTLKIAGLLVLSLCARMAKWKRARAWAFKRIEIVDPWITLEVAALAFIVSIAQVGRIATVRPGAGVFSFGAVVVLMICATIAFDPRQIGMRKNRTSMSEATSADRTWRCPRPDSGPAARPLFGSG